jgi:hypothetical protein
MSKRCRFLTSSCDQSINTQYSCIKMNMARWDSIKSSLDRAGRLQWYVLVSIAGRQSSNLITVTDYAAVLQCLLSVYTCANVEVSGPKTRYSAYSCHSTLSYTVHHGIFSGILSSQSTITLDKGTRLRRPTRHCSFVSLTQLHELK